MEAKFIATFVTVQEIVWLRSFLNHLGLIVSQNPLIIYCDSQSSISFLGIPKFHRKTKHIVIKYHFVRYLFTWGEVNLKYIPIQEMIMDPFDDFIKYVVSLALSRMGDNTLFCIPLNVIFQSINKIIFSLQIHYSQYTYENIVISYSWVKKEHVE